MIYHSKATDSGRLASRVDKSNPLKLIGQFIGRETLVKVTEDETGKSLIEALHHCKIDIKIF